MRDTQIRVPTRRASGSGSAAGRPLFATRGPSLALRSGRDDPGCGQGRIGGTGFKNQRGAKARGRDGLDSARPGPRPPCPPRAAHSRWLCPQGSAHGVRAASPRAAAGAHAPAPHFRRLLRAQCAGSCLARGGERGQRTLDARAWPPPRRARVQRNHGVASQCELLPALWTACRAPPNPLGKRSAQAEAAGGGVVGSERGSPTAGTWGGGPGTFRLHPRKSALREREEGASRRRDASPSGHHVLCAGATRVSPAQSGSSRKEDLSETRERLRLHPSPSHAAPWGVTYTQDQDIVGARGHGDSEGRVRREGRSGGAAPPV